MQNNQDKETNIQEVLIHAVEIFSNCGIEKAKMKDIAKNAGISERTIYRYYPTKDDLIKAVVIDSIKKTKRNVERHLSDSEFQKLDGMSQTIDLARGLLHYAINSKKQQLSMDEIEVYMKRFELPDAFSLYDNRDNEMVKAFRKTIQKGIDDKTIRTEIFTNKSWFTTIAIAFRGFMNRIAVISFDQELRENYNVEEVIENYLWTLKLLLSSQ